FRGDDEIAIAERELLVTVMPPPWRSWYAYLLYILLVGLAAAAVARYTYLQNQLKLEQVAKDQQAALHRAKLRFFTNITHELRTPLTLMLGPLESIRERGEIKGAVAERLWSVEKNSRRLLDLVNQLLSFRKLAGERESLHLDGRDIVEFSRDVLHSFRELARERDIRLRHHSQEEHLELSFDADKIEKILYNLLANAFKFTPAGGRVDLELRREGSKVHFRVSDTGEGIPMEIQDKIFARFFERKSLTRREGTGIGLAIVREYVEMHGGEITVNSSPGLGSTFQFWLPFRPAMMVTVPEDAWAGATAVQEPPLEKHPILMVEAEDPPPLILVVEDNLEVRDYIESVLLSKYRLETAAHGKEGLEKARQLAPELIVSDVMMPEMDGIAFCAALKEDLRTSHIPLILLTANSTDLQRLHGLETGADDYLTKPFSPRELQLRIRNILRSVKLARQKAANTLKLEPGEIQVTPADTKFLEKAIDLVNLHMDDTRYKVDDFARDLAVSRALLFTKMKSITDHTPNSFIKMLRMKRAAQLLGTGELNVAEVAGRVGYRDVKYFSKSFRVAYGCPPSAYRESTDTAKATGN
ncbi:MAG: ATP-binding protein, partial [Bacteroidota bacterium]